MHLTDSARIAFYDILTQMNNSELILILNK